ncbi:hypothetical protein V499_00477 [Pseudogymnoascus sp. VKM F-103]|nr:hypothetical protein V499_00477 [Pseudogymnoascus sp. VKM F-103]
MEDHTHYMQITNNDIRIFNNTASVHHLIMEVQEIGVLVLCIAGCDEWRPERDYTAYPSSMCDIGGIHGPSELVCNFCVKDYLRGQCFKEDGSVATARCIQHGCGRALVREDLKVWFTPDELKKYDYGMIRNHLNYRKCECGEGEIHENPGESVTCSQCGAAICFECEMTITPTHDCSIFAERSVRSLRRHILRDPYLGTRDTDKPEISYFCPGCDIHLGAGPGCFHITCEPCSTQFCLGCLQFWKQPGGVLLKAKDHLPECAMYVEGLNWVIHFPHEAVKYRGIRARRQAEENVRAAEARSREGVVGDRVGEEGEAEVAGAQTGQRMPAPQSQDEPQPPQPQRRRRRVARRLVSSSVGIRAPRRPAEDWEAHDRMWSQGDGSAEEICFIDFGCPVELEKVHGARAKKTRDHQHTLDPSDGIRSMPVVARLRTLNI